VEEDILDIELMDHLVLGEGKGQDNLNGDKLDDEAKDLIVVHSGAPSEASKDLMGLVGIE
jgi:hypothetical protein